MPFPITVKPVMIANGTAVSTIAYIGDGDFIGLVMPAGWDAAGITFQGGVALPNTPVAQSPATETGPPVFANLFNQGGNEVTITSPAAGEQITIPEDMINGCEWIKIRSGTSGSPVNQTADRTLYVIVQKRPQYVPR